MVSLPSSNWQEYMILHYRWLPVLFLLLPLSTIYNVTQFLRHRLLRHIFAHRHRQNVQNVQKQVRDWVKSDSNLFMTSSRAGYETMSTENMLYKSQMHLINVQNLTNIMEINDDHVWVEPNVNIGQLTRVLNPLELTLAVVPELDELTIGGLVMGMGLESSSFQQGLFQDICTEYELILADGSLIHCNANNEHSDLFHAIPGSYGTLGFLTAVKLRVVQAKKFVKVKYEKCNHLEEALEVTKNAMVSFESSSNSLNFIEWIIFSSSHIKVMIGQATNEALNNENVNEIGRFYKKWYYKHVETVLDKSEELIPLNDYYHRHTRSIFWELEDIIPFGNNPLFRYTLGMFVPPKVSLLKLTQGKTLKRLYEQHHIVQDLLIPMGVLKEALKLIEQVVDVHPIWICPFKLNNHKGFLRRNKKSDGHNNEMFVDIGLYGTPKASGFDALATIRKLESFVRNVHGYQMLYADCYMSREEFRATLDHELYDRMRIKYGGINAFPDIYDKVNKWARSGEKCNL